MSTEDMIEILIENGVKAYKKNSKKSKEFNRLNRHESVIIDGINFNYWREYGVYKAAEFLKENCPQASIVVNLDGNNSSLSIDISDNAQKKINYILYSFLKKQKFV